MIIMDIKADNLFAFKNFHINMSYPKKITGSSIECEHLEDRKNFRYKKVNVLMGGNATGKTSLGLLLMRFANYFIDGETSRFKALVNDSDHAAKLQIDFVTSDNLLNRFSLDIRPDHNENVSNAKVKIEYVNIAKSDNYEVCALKLDEGKGREIPYEEVRTNGWGFLYPHDSMDEKTYAILEDEENYLYILEKVLKTLDPSIEKIVKIKEVDNSYAIRLNNRNVIIQDGKILDNAVLSSGTKEGLDIAYVITALISNKHDLLYCDELFSYVNSDVEKACLSVMVDRLTGNKQLFFTTHNSDILDMQLPKHSFTFLKKNVYDEEEPIKCISASDYLKRNTDSVKCAVENDLFCTVPELDGLYALMEI
ncbi:MAG: ATP-binding protein [Clostridia bacterium]|nr:ATP-binding protein [Clostridia bacterium]